MASKHPNSPANSSDVSLAKKVKRMQRWREVYATSYPVLKVSSKGVHFAYCTVCHRDFSISHGGMNDCAVHVNGPRHKQYAASKSSQPTLADFSKAKQDQDNLTHQVTNAELMFANFLVEHNVSMAAADHAGPLFRGMFPDSKIAAKYGSARTKTTALIKHQAEKYASEISENAQSVFSLSTDGSNDNADKFYPVILQYLNSSGMPQTSLLSVPTVKEVSATGRNIYNTLNSELEKHGLAWRNCLALGADNAPVMSGNNTGLFGCIKEEQPNLYFAGCPCHLMHLGAKKGAAALGLKLEDALTDIYYYLKHSAKRQAELKIFQELCGTKQLKVLKHVSTRWLSMNSCTQRLLSLWVPLRDYFASECQHKERDEEAPITRPQRARDFLISHTNHALCHFLTYVLEIFDHANMALQSERPLIHKSRRILLDLYRKLLLKFLKPVAFTGKLVTDIEITTPYHQKSDAELCLGEETRKYMVSKKMTDQKIKNICSNARTFYHTAARYLLQKLPLRDTLLEQAEVFDPLCLPSKTFQSIKYFVERFPSVKPDCSMDTLEEQFILLQVEALPNAIHQENNVAQQWAIIGSIKDATGHPKFKHIVHIAQRILLIPHSNAGCERVFSAVRKIRTDFRGSMQPATLDAVCTVKMQGNVCHLQTYSRPETVAAKHATKLSLEN